MAELNGPEHGQVHLEKCGEEAALDNVARVGGAPLFGVFEAFSDVLGQEVPLREVPHTPGIEALLLEHATSAGVRQGDGGAPTVRPSAPEDESAYSLRADQYVAHARSHAGYEGDRKSGAPHQCMGEGQSVKATLARGL